VLFERGVSARKFSTTNIDVFDEDVDGSVMHDFKEKLDHDVSHEVKEVKA
jgi:SP family general alpha glucoside:H+ symporter-like MFS transporter